MVKNALDSTVHAPLEAALPSLRLLQTVKFFYQPSRPFHVPYSYNPDLLMLLLSHQRLQEHALS